MNLQQLRYFKAVADLRHFTQAAESVGVTQPSLSKQIHSLEKELGAPLFERATGALTAAGEALLPIAVRVLADVDAAHREVQDLVGLRRGRVRLGATPSLCVSLVPPLLRRFHDRHPGVELHIEEGGSQDLVRALGHGELDLALIVLPGYGMAPGLRAEPLFREGLVVASVEPLLEPGDRLRVTDLRGRPLVMFRAGYDLRDATLQACHEAGFEPTFTVEGGEMDAVLSLVEAGLGIAVVPGIVVPGRPRLVATQFRKPGLWRTIALARRREATLPHAARALRDELMALLREADRDRALPSGVELL